MGRAFLSFCFTSRSRQVTMRSSKAVMARPNARGNTAPMQSLGGESSGQWLATVTATRYSMMSIRRALFYPV